jgi:hypothetical protein
MELHMTAQELDLTLVTTPSETEEEYSIPLDISDIISICREFNKLGYQMQNQVENILEVGVEESIKNGFVKKESLPHIKSFLLSICKNAYFGDAVLQAQDCIALIQDYEDSYRLPFASGMN